MRLSQILTEKGWTYRRLATETGYTEAHLNNIANERNDCTTAVVMKCAEVLGVTVDEILADPKTKEGAGDSQNPASTQDQASPGNDEVD